MENLVKKFNGKRVLITGHTGFKGAWLSKILLNWGAQVSGIALKPTTDPNLFDALKIKNEVKNYFVDIRDFNKIENIIFKEKPDIVFHLAAQPIVIESYNNPLYTFETNIIGTANVLHAIKKLGTVKSAVMITTDKVYRNNESGRPFKEEDPLGGHDPYSASKAAAEIIINSNIKSFFNPIDYKRKHETLVASARAGNVIGGGDWSANRLVPDMIKAIFKNERVIIRNPEAIRPWQHVLEALYGYMLLATKLHDGKKEFSGAWNLGPSHKNFLTVKEFVESASKILKNSRYVVKRDPNSRHENKLLTLNSNKAKKHLGWQQKLNIDKTLELTFEWYKSFYNKEDIIQVTNKQIELFFK